MSIGAGSGVALKSGGPEMTVRWVEDEEACCEWFDKDNELKSSTFVLSSLDQAQD